MLERERERELLAMCSFLGSYDMYLRFSSTILVERDDDK